jgi:hypothetical protein
MNHKEIEARMDNLEAWLKRLGRSIEEVEEAAFVTSVIQSMQFAADGAELQPIIKRVFTDEKLINELKQGLTDPQDLQVCNRVIQKMKSK